GPTASQPTGSTGGGGGATGGAPAGSTGAAPTGSTGSAPAGNTASDSAPTGSGGDSSGTIDFGDCPALEALVASAGLSTAFGAVGTTGARFAMADFQRLVDAAPNEIKSDLQVIANVLNEFFTTLEELNVDLNNPAWFATLSQDDLVKLDELTSKLDTPEIGAASARLEAYFQEKCD